MADNFFDLAKSMQHSLLIGAESQLRTSRYFRKRHMAVLDATRIIYFTINHDI